MTKDFNEFGEELEEKIREEKKRLRETDAKLRTLYQRRKELLQKQIFPLHEGFKLDVFMAELIEHFAKTCYFEHKDGVYMPPHVESDQDLPVDSGLEPTLIWIKSRMKDFKDIPGFDNEAAEIRPHLIEVIENNREQWDIEYEQIRKKHIATIILF